MKNVFLLLSIFFTISAYTFASISGSAYLVNKYNHSGINVVFLADSPSAASDSTYTLNTGYYSIALNPGVYKVKYSYPGFETYYMNKGDGVLLANGSILEDVTLVPGDIKILTGPLSGILYGDKQYIVEGDIIVESGRELIIEPGAELNFNNGTGIIVSGKLTAIGKPNSRIIFKSVSNSPQRGIWEGININSSSVSKLSYCNIEFPRIGIDVSYSKAEISHCRISNTSWNGIRLSSTNAIIFANDISNFSTSGIMIDQGSPTIQCNYIYNGTQNCIYAYAKKAIIENNIMKSCSVGIATDLGDFYIHNNYISNCSYGINIRFLPGNIDVINNTICTCYAAIKFDLPKSNHQIYRTVKNNILFGNSRGISQDSKIASNEYTHDMITYNLLFGNTLNFSNLNPVGLGSIITKNHIGIESDAYYNIFVDPKFNNDNLPDIFYDSPAINSGDPSIIEPDETISDIGANLRKYNCGKDEILSVKDIQGSNLIVYPNPAREYIEIILDSEAISGRCWTSHEIHIYNSIGEKILVGIQNLEPLRIDTSALPTGIYYLHYAGQYMKFVKL